MKTVSIQNQKTLAEDTKSDYETVSLSIGEDGIDYLMGTLTNLYTHPAEAVFREYVSNALDSHIAANQNQPIQVELKKSNYAPPTVNTFHGNIPYLKVQDFGVGMSKEEIINVYSRYGSSTKRDNNDEIGGFGLGAKSALAIAERFDVTSIKNGIKTEFFIKKNNKGVGIIHFVSETETKDLNGVTVYIPIVNSKNFEDINQLVKQKEFFKTWKPGTVIFNSKLLAVEETVYDKKRFIPIYLGEQEIAWVEFLNNSILESHGFSSYGNSDKIPSFSISGISYTLNSISTASSGNTFGQRLVEKNPLMETTSGSFLNQLGTTGISVVINLPIGSVDLTPSRENLMVTDRTSATIETLFDTLYKEIPFAFLSKLNSLPLKEAWNFYKDNLVVFKSTDPPATSRNGYERQYLITETYNVAYAGKPIPNKLPLQNLFFIRGINTTKWGDSWVNESELNLLTFGARERNGSVNQTYINLCNFNNPKYYKQEQILVYGIVSPKKEEDFATITRNARSYSLAVGGTKNIDIFYVRSKTKPSNKWLNVIAKPISIQELEQVGKEYRSNEAKKLAAAKIGNKTPKQTAIHFGVTTNKNNELVVKKFNSKEIAVANKVIFICETQCLSRGYSSPYFSQLNNLWDSLNKFSVEAVDFSENSYGAPRSGSILRGAPVPASILRGLKPFFEQMVSYLPETLIILVPKARSINPLVKTAPHGKILLDYINDQLVSMSKSKAKIGLLKKLATVPIDTTFYLNPIIQNINKTSGLNKLHNKITKKVFKEVIEEGPLYRLVMLINIFIGQPVTLSRRFQNDLNQRVKLINELVFSETLGENSWWKTRYNVINPPFLSVDSLGSYSPIYTALVNAIDDSI